MSRNSGGMPGVFGHTGYGFGVEIENVVAAQPGAHQSGPSIAGEVAGKEAPLAAKLLALGVDIVHELVDKRDRYLLDLALGVGHLAHEDVAGGVDATFGFGVQHQSSLKLSTFGLDYSNGNLE